MPAPHLHVYPQYAVIAEKLEAIVSLGMGNTRMKDYFDLWVLARHAEINDAILAQAVHATFARRGTRIPGGIPVGLADGFASDRRKKQQWEAFLHKNGLAQVSLDRSLELCVQPCWPRCKHSSAGPYKLLINARLSSSSLRPLRAA